MNSQNATEARNFWNRLTHGRPLTFCHEAKLNENFQIQNPELLQGTWKQDKGSSSEKSRQDQPENPPEPSSNKSKEIAKEPSGGKYRFIEHLQPYQRTENADLELSVSLTGRFCEDAKQNYWVWKTKWNLPAITVKTVPQGLDGYKLSDSLLLDILMVESNGEAWSNLDHFNVVFDSIRGYTRKQLVAGGCQFKNLKINRKGDTFTYRFLLLPFLYDKETPRNRQYFDCFLSEEVAVYLEGSIMQIDKLEGLEQYFELFEPSSFDMPLKPKIEPDTQLKMFENYMFKKAVKVKNIVYLAYKFPEVISLYGNAAIFKDETTGKVRANVCELIHQNSEEMTLGSAPIANYLNPDAKLVLHIACDSHALKILICKDFTGLLSIIVDQSFEPPETLIQFDDPALLKESYQEYSTKLASEKRPERKRNSESMEEDESEEFEGDSSESSHYDEGTIQSHLELTKKNAEARNLRNRKELDNLKKVQKSTPVLSAANTKYPMRKRIRRNENTKEEESSFDENEEEDSVVGRGRKPRIAVLNDMKKKKEKVKAKNEEKAKEAGKQPWAQGPATSMPMVPTGAIPYGSGMIPMMPYPTPGSANKPMMWMDKKGSYAQMMPGMDLSKDKNDSGKAQAGGKPEMPAMAMPMNSFMGMMPGMPGMSGMPGIPMMMPGMSMPGMTGMPSMPGMPGMSAMPSIPGMPPGFAAVPPGSDIYKMLMQQQSNKASQDGSSGANQSTSEDGGKDPKKPDWSSVMMGGMPNFASLSGMSMPGMQTMLGAGGMPNVIGMPLGMAGMMFGPGGAQAMQAPGAGQSSGVMPYVIMSNPTGAAGQQKPGSANETQRKQGEKDGSDKKTQKPQNPMMPGFSMGMPGMPGIPGFELNSNVLQQMTGGMPGNYFSMGGAPGGMMQFMMPGQQSGSQQSSQPTMAFPFPGGMSGLPPQYASMMSGQNPMFSMSGMPPGMMMGAMPQQKPNDQTKAAEENKGKEQKANGSADKANGPSSTNTNQNSQTRIAANIPGMPPGAFFMPGMQAMPGMSLGMPSMPGMTAMSNSQQPQQLPYMMMSPQMMQQLSSMQSPTSTTDSAAQSMQSLQQNMQMLQNMTSTQLGQIGMAPYLPQTMMAGMPFMSQPNVPQRSNSINEKKKDDDKK